MRTCPPFDTAELDSLRQRQRELLVAIDRATISETLAVERVRRLKLPDAAAFASSDWVGAELQVRNAVEELLGEEPAAQYASACRARRAAELYYRATLLIEPFEFADHWTANASTEREQARYELGKVTRSLPRSRLVIGALVESLLLAEIVATDSWEFAPLTDALGRARPTG